MSLLYILDQNTGQFVPIEVTQGATGFQLTVQSESLPPMLAARLTGFINGRPARIIEVNGRRNTADGVTFEASPTLTDITDYPMTNGRYYEPTGLESLQLVCASANDTAGGIGVQSVDIVYLDTNYILRTVTVATNGGTQNLAFNAGYVWWMHTRAVGSNRDAEGNITLQTTSGDILDRILAGGNQSLSARIKVPSNTDGYIFQFYASNPTSNTTQDVRLRAEASKLNRDKIGPYLFQSTMFLGGQNSDIQNLPYIHVPPLADIKVSTISSSANNARLDTHFHMLLLERV